MKQSRTERSVTDAFERDEFDEGEQQLRVAAGAAKPLFVSLAQDAIRVFYASSPAEYTTCLDSSWEVPPSKMPLSDEIHEDDDDKEGELQSSEEGMPPCGRKPAFVHQLFHRERIVGYRAPNVRVVYANPSLRCFIRISHDGALEEAELRDDIPGLLSMASPPAATHGASDEAALRRAFAGADVSATASSAPALPSSGAGTSSSSSSPSSAASSSTSAAAASSANSSLQPRMADGPGGSAGHSEEEEEEKHDDAPKLGTKRGRPAEGGKDGEDPQDLQRGPGDAGLVRQADRPFELGTALMQYSCGECDSGSEFEVRTWGLSEPAAQAFHRRVEATAVWHIEALDGIGISPETTWHAVAVFRKQAEGSGAAPQVPLLVSYASLIEMHNPFADPERPTVLRVAQALVLPPFQRQGHGEALLRGCYELGNKRGAREVQVEDPAPGYARLRRTADFRRVLATGLCRGALPRLHQLARGTGSGGPATTAASTGAGKATGAAGRLLPRCSLPRVDPIPEAEVSGLLRAAEDRISADRSRATSPKTATAAADSGIAEAPAPLRWAKAPWAVQKRTSAEPSSGSYHRQSLQAYRRLAVLAEAAAAQLLLPRAHAMQVVRDMAFAEAELCGAGGGAGSTASTTSTSSSSSSSSSLVCAPRDHRLLCKRILFPGVEDVADRRARLAVLEASYREESLESCRVLASLGLATKDRLRAEEEALAGAQARAGPLVEAYNAKQQLEQLKKAGADVRQGTGGAGIGGEGAQDEGSGSGGTGGLLSGLGGLGYVAGYALGALQSMLGGGSSEGAGQQRAGAESPGKDDEMGGF